MILNGYAILDFFVVLLRLLFGLLVFFLSLYSWKSTTAAISPETKWTQEQRHYLLFLMALLLLGLIVVSWPLFYLLLQSYVAEWPEVMCIYGVTQIGAGSEGPSRFLPGLITTLQFAKPVLVFISGVWFVLYLVNRQTQTSPLIGRLLAILMILGLLAAGDALVEAAYLVIPKREVFVDAGCCTEAMAENSRGVRFLTQAIFGTDYRPWLYAAYYGINLGMILGLAWYVRKAASSPARPGLGLLVLGAMISLAVNWIFLVEAAAPALLHLPHHHCPYDLLPKVPESIVGVALFILGSFAVGWGACVSWFARCPETGPLRGRTLVTILQLAVFCYFGSLVILSMELALA